MLFLCAALFFTCSVPAFASEDNVDVSNVLKELNAKASLSSTSDLIDGQAITETIHGAKVFNINVADLDSRRIITVSNVPLKVIITNSAFPTSVVNYV